MLSSLYLLLFNGAILTVCAVFVDAYQPTLHAALMLFLPLLDMRYRKLDFMMTKEHLVHWLSVCSLITLLIVLNPSQFQYLTAIIIYTALPEEWFFRRYIQQFLNLWLASYTIAWQWLPASIIANFITSVFFTVLHLPTQGLAGLAVFIPSLFLGWLYQKKQDIVLVVLVHTMFNVFYISYLRMFL